MPLFRVRYTLDGKHYNRMFRTSVEIDNWLNDFDNTLYPLGARVVLIVAKS